MSVLDSISKASAGAARLSFMPHVTGISEVVASAGSAIRVPPHSAFIHHIHGYPCVLQVFKKPDPKELVRKWQADLRSEQRKVDRQIRGVWPSQREFGV